MLWCNSGKPGTNQTLACVWSPAEVTRHSTKTGQLGGSWYKHYGLKTLEAETIKEKTWGAIKFFEMEKTFAIICDFGHRLSGVCVFGGGAFWTYDGEEGGHKKISSFSRCMLWGNERERSRTSSKETERQTLLCSTCSQTATCSGCCLRWVTLQLLEIVEFCNGNRKTTSSRRRFQRQLV